RSVAVLFAIPHPRLNCLDQDATHGVLNSFTRSEAQGKGEGEPQARGGALPAGAPASMGADPAAGLVEGRSAIFIVLQAAAWAAAGTAVALPINGGAMSG
ncbi:MAG: hypothetical protein LW835_12710, partial [Burkholderiaceae bacterium]|nr:hypothetical protein [Burkholderiaceae bacterium]